MLGIFFALLGTLLAGLYLFMLVLTLFYWYESINHPCPDLPAPPLSASALLVFAGHASYGLLANLAGVILHYGTRLLPERLGKVPPPSMARPPVICVHGLWHSPPGWFFMRRAIRRAGFLHCTVCGYSSFRYSRPDQIAPVLEEAVAAMEQRVPGEKPLLVGHSLGGLIIRQWLATGANAARVRGVLTLGTPQRGSALAALAFGKLGRSLLPDNPFFANLEEAEHAAKERPLPAVPPVSPVPHVALVTRYDEMVVPADSLLPPGPEWEWRATPTCSHIGLIFRPACIRMAVRELTVMAEAGATPAGPTQ